MPFRSQLIGASRVFLYNQYTGLDHISMFSPINRPGTKPIWSSLIMCGSIPFILFAIEVEANL